MSKRLSESRRESYKPQNYTVDSLNKRRAESCLIRKDLRSNYLLLNRLKSISTENHEQINNLEPGMEKETGGFLMRNQTVGHILCCQCGTSIPPNNANMCNFCLRLEGNAAGVLPSRVHIIHCPDCKSYLQPPTTWLKAERESKELLAFCLKRLKKLSEFRIVDAKFLVTEPNSKRIKLQLKVQSEVLNQVYVEKSHTVEYVVLYQSCPACWRIGADPNAWEAVVQVRQKVSHMRTFFFLEQCIIKHNAAQDAVKLKPVKNQGVDFYFSRKTDAMKFFAFLTRVVPIKQQKFCKKLMSEDKKSNICRYRYSVCAVICPVCHDDLVYLPTKLSVRLGQLGPLVICTRVRNTISLLNPFTLQRCVMSADQYWRESFEPLLCSKQLVEYIVLDVESVSPEVVCKQMGYTVAEVQIARVSDFGKNDRISSVRTHLGYLLKPGDYALGYDLCGANFNNSEAEACRVSFPDAILIKKSYGEQNRMSLKGSVKGWKNSEYQQFLKDLEVNPELRFNISLDGNKQGPPLMSPTAARDHDTVTFDELDDVFAGLDLSDDEEGWIADTD